MNIESFRHNILYEIMFNILAFTVQSHHQSNGHNVLRSSSSRLPLSARMLSKSKYIQHNNPLSISYISDNSTKNILFPINRFTEDTFHFKSKSVDQDRLYEVTLNFLHKINPEKIVTKNTTRYTEYTITKAEVGPYWKSLTNDKRKPHFIKADFNKWRDEDDDDEGM